MTHRDSVMTAASDTITSALVNQAPYSNRFGFEPDWLFIYLSSTIGSISQGYGGYTGMYVKGVSPSFVSTLTQTSRYVSTYTSTVTSSGISWYSNTNAQGQMNVSGATYMYIAIG